MTRHRRRLLAAIPCLLVTLVLFSGETARAQDAQGSTDDLLADFTWRNIGPANMMGRISAIDALNDDFRTVLIGSASGGVWKSTNAGTTFQPIFDEYGSQSIGDVAFYQPDPEIIWVGTGEATNRNSVGWGDGIYRSTDGGETFEHMGLRDTYQIGEIEPHPSDPDVVYVAAAGNLWGYTGRRGLFKTTDGGRTWTKLTNGLPDDGRTGATDVEIDPGNPDVLYVGMYHRLRRPWGMHSGGPNGGIYKSTDGGESWTKLTDGLPEGATGMIDIDVYREDPSTLVAYVEASEELPRDLSVPGSGIYRSDDGGESWRYLLRHTSRPYYHGNVRINPSDDDLIYVVSRHTAYSEDGGETWERGSNWSSGGGDDHDMWISPEHRDVLYTATDQGAHLTMGDDAHISFTNMAIGQYYKIGVDMRDPYWVYGGLQDNGGWAIPSNSRSRNGIRTKNAIEVNGGDGFAMEPDPTDWRTVYTTAHVGYFGRIDMVTRERAFITPTPETTTNFDEYYDPDYAETQTDYTINPGEYWLWGDLRDRSVNGSILPPQFRWNWNSPLVLSPHDPETVYVGSNHLFRSTDRGETWEIISPDLTRNDPATRNTSRSGGLVRDATGAENNHTIFTIEPSPLDRNLIWVGSDDGLVHVTRDGGETWTDVTENIRAADVATGAGRRGAGSGVPAIPDTIWVGQVEASHSDEGTAYVAFDNHRMGDNSPYLFKTTDYGASWTDITANLPREVPGTVIYDVVEDHENPELLFVGTEFGVYVSVDGGERWSELDAELPPVAVRDLVIHPRDDDLVAGTHGRSIWILDDIDPLQQLTPEVLAADVHLFESRVATRWLDLTDYGMRTSLKFVGGNPPEGAAIDFFLAADPADSVRAEVEDTAAGRTWTTTVDAHAGINRVRWGLRFPPTDAQVREHREMLRRVRDETVRRVEDTDQDGLLEIILDDLLSPHYSPDPYDDFEYPDAADGRREYLLAHLEAIGGALDEAESTRDFSQVRSQLMAFSPVVGDTAFFGLYGEALRGTEAEPGAYAVRVIVDGEAHAGTVTVRADPMLGEAEGEGVAAGAVRGAASRSPTADDGDRRPRERDAGGHRPSSIP